MNDTLFKNFFKANISDVITKPNKKTKFKIQSHNGTIDFIKIKDY